MYKPQYVKEVLDTPLKGRVGNIVDKLAEGVHDSWAYNRLQQGWQYGNSLDSTRKTHPSLVPYQELPEDEKNIDRDTVEIVLKLLIKQGYVIDK